MTYLDNHSPTGGERVASALAHASIFFLPLVMPLLVFFLYPVLFAPSPYVRSQTWQSLIFHVIVLITTGMLSGLAVLFFHIFLIGWPFGLACGVAAFAIGLWAAIMEFIAAIKVLQGQPARLPIVGGWS